jgi:hypothetical protein
LPQASVEVESNDLISLSMSGPQKRARAPGYFLVLIRLHWATLLNDDQLSPNFNRAAFAPIQGSSVVVALAPMVVLRAKRKGRRTSTATTPVRVDGSWCVPALSSWGCHEPV